VKGVYQRYVVLILLGCEMKNTADVVAEKHRCESCEELGAARC